MLPVAFKSLVAGLALVGLASGAAAAEEPPCSYIVKTGDTLYAIGQEFGLTQAQVEASNPDVEDVSLIRPGDVLTLPCNGTATKGSTVLDLLAHRPDMGVLFRAVVAANFTDMLDDPKLVGTLFAPNDTAFDQLLTRLNLTATDLLADKELLSTVLKYHFVPEEALKAKALKDGLNITTALEGQDLVVFKPKEVVRLATTSGQKVRVEEADLKGGKALVHTVKSVLWPAASLGDLPDPSADCVHEVVAGDVLYDIAQEVGTTTAELIELNPELEADDGQKLQPGMELILFPSCAV